MTEIPISFPDEYHQAIDLLSTSAIKTGHSVRMRVVGDSMSPLMLPGDTLVITKCEQSAILMGELVIINSADGYIVHRVVFVRNGRIITKGDNRPKFDVESSLGDLIGKAVTIERNGKISNLNDNRQKLLNKIIGWISWLEGYSHEYVTKQNPTIREVNTDRNVFAKIVFSIIRRLKLVVLKSFDKKQWLVG
jgi:signal peptidase I